MSAAGNGWSRSEPSNPRSKNILLFLIYPWFCFKFIHIINTPSSFICPNPSQQRMAFYNSWFMLKVATCKLMSGRLIETWRCASERSFLEIFRFKFDISLTDIHAASRASLMKVAPPPKATPDVTKKRPPLPKSDRLDQRALLAGIKRKPWVLFLLRFVYVITVNSSPLIRPYSSL